jgi:hypothetical protein
MSCDCGIKPLLFGGWCQPACRDHDLAYMNSEHTTFTRAYIDRKFLLDCLRLAKKGRCQAGKRAASYAMYAIVRATGGLWWDGAE